MKIHASVTGLWEEIKRQKRAHEAAMARIPMGLKRAGLLLIRESLKVVPVDTGNLKASWFVRSFGAKEKAYVLVGYTAAYGLYVHENMEAAHGAAYNAKHALKIAAKATMPDGTGRAYFKRGVNQKAKFLTDPAIANRAKMRLIFQETVSGAFRLNGGA